MATWVSRIPAAQAKLQMSPAVLGLVLLGTATGSLMAMPATGWLIAHYGSRIPTQWATFLLCLALLPIAFVRSPVELWAALFLFGVASGSQNVAMNTHAVSVEEGYSRPLMGSFHARWSLGAMAGSALGGWAAGSGFVLPIHFALVACAASLFTAAVVGWLHRPNHSGPVARLTFRIPRAVAGLGLIGFAISIAEGSAADWSAVYLDSVIGSGAGRAALGFSAYSAAMIVSRLLSDRITPVIGRQALVRVGSLAGFAGLAITLATQSYGCAVFGFALMGLGVATIIPNVFGAAGRVPGIPSGVGMAAVTTAAYMGFLGGPPLIGGIAQGLGLRMALCFVLLCLLLAAACASLVPEVDARVRSGK